MTVICGVISWKRRRSCSGMLRDELMMVMIRPNNCLPRNVQSRDVVEKQHNAIVKFNTYRNLQRHRAVLLVIARLVCKIADAVKSQEFDHLFKAQLSQCSAYTGLVFEH